MLENSWFLTNNQLFSYITSCYLKITSCRWLRENNRLLFSVAGIDDQGHNYPKKSSLWYSQILFQIYSKQDEVKKASLFTSEDIDKFLFDKNIIPQWQSRYWLVRRAYVVVAYFGGLRCMEMHNIDLEDLEQSPEGFHVTINRTKQGGKSSQSKFMIPCEG